MSSLATESARVAALTRSRPASDPDLIAARRAAKSLRLERDLRRELATEPSLTRDERRRLAALLVDAGAA